MMDSTETTLDLDALGAQIRFPFRGQAAQSRFLAGSGLMLAGMFVPILPAILVYGYLLRVMRGSMRGEPSSLPAWDDWSTMLLDGLKATAIGLVYLLPGWLVMMAGFAVYFLAGPISMAFLQSGRSGSAPSLWPLVGLFGGMAVMMLSLSLGMLLSILGTVPLPVALGRFVASGRIGDAFQLRAIWRLIRSAFWRYLSVWVVVMGLAGIVYFLYMIIYFTWVLCFVALLILPPAMFYVLAVGAGLFGQFYRQGQADATTDVDVQARPAATAGEA